MAAAAVARIAYLASDVLIDVRPSFSRNSSFPCTFNTPAQSRASLVSLPPGGDPVAAALGQSNASLISLTSSTSSKTILNIVLRLSELTKLPVVLHFVVDHDLSDVILLRSAVPYFLISSTSQEAHDNALLASKLARTQSNAVVHVFYDAHADAIQEVPEDQILPFLLDDTPSRLSHPTINGGHQEVNGNANGINGYANGSDYRQDIGVNAQPNETALPSGDSNSKDTLFNAYQSAAFSTIALIHRPIRCIKSRGSTSAETVVFSLGRELPCTVDNVLIHSISLVHPIPTSHLLSAIPPTARNILVLEDISRWSMKWTPLYLDVVSALQQRESKTRPVVRSGILGNVVNVGSTDFLEFLHSVLSSPPSLRLELGPTSSQILNNNPEPYVPKHEVSYTKVLNHLFGNRLDIANSPSLVASQGEMATTPEFALGRVRGQIDERSQLVSAIQELLQSSSLDKDLHALLSRWSIAKEDPSESKKLGDEIVVALDAAKLDHGAARKVLLLKSHLAARSRWIIGSDAWSYDIGSSGLHHLIVSGLNVNILIIDSLPYTSRNGGDPTRRKRDVGLYAMNHGDVFVASVAVYSSYAQVLQAFLEADKYDGPSVVLAYLPYESDASPALEVLKETKLAVDSGYWPLYRWDPSKEHEGKEPFSLDSDVIKSQLQAFLDRQNHLSQLVRPKPQMASELVSSLGQTLKDARKQRAQQAYRELLSGLDAPPVTILYASDSGTAEKKAKRLFGRAKARGLSPTLAPMDSMPLDTLAEQEYVLFLTSTSGQGEPPQNARMFYKAINAAVASGERILSKLKYSVFGMGDSHYWPRAEDSIYYNKPGRDLDHRLEKLGGERVVDLGLGDDQDADGPETGYKAWEPLVWKALGVDSAEITEAEPEVITNEHIKAASNFLRGTIVEGLADPTTGAIAPSDGQVSKFHGFYQQDDRDIRDERQTQGLEPAYSFMIRVRMSAGVCTPEQWLQMDKISEEHGNGTFKLTTRATFQFHGVIKKHLKPAIQDINRVLLDTIAACGDVTRNVTCSTIPTLSRLHAQVFEFCKDVSEHLLPRASAYHEIFLDKKLVAGDAVKDFEPLYGPYYLPRKYKLAVAVPPSNDVDIFASDIGFIAIQNPDGSLAGFNVTIGGGMGVTHGNKKTYPRMADIIGFCTYAQGKEIAEAVMLIQRDNGNRVDRKNARLKYTLDRMGMDLFMAELEKLIGYKLAPARPFVFDRNIDDFGWATGEDGRHHFMAFIENGRVQDEPGRNFKTGLREIAKVHKGTFRLTANQHLLVSDIPDEELPLIKELLAKYKLDNLAYSGLRLASSACVAFPTCGLAMAESERYLPLLIDKVEKICEENGLRNDSIVLRMSGCPNGCSRPYIGEVAFVGKAVGSYMMLLGGGYYGQRLNKIYRDAVSEPEILSILRPMIKRYALERHEGERFGDWTIRAGYIAPATVGKEWYDRSGGEGEWKQ